MRLRIILSSILLLFSFTLSTTVSAFPTFSYIVGDSTQPDPKNVGFVVSISTEIDPRSISDPSLVGSVPPPRNTLAFVPIPKVPGPDSWKIGLSINPDEIPIAGTIFFITADCSGPPWIGEFQVNAEFDPTFDPHVVIGDSLDPNIRTLYAADQGAPLSPPMGFNSVISEFTGPGCTPFSGNMQAKPAILVDADLHQTFPPPYNLFFEFSATGTGPEGPQGPPGPEGPQGPAIDSTNLITVTQNDTVDFGETKHVSALCPDLNDILINGGCSTGAGVSIIGSMPLYSNIEADKWECVFSNPVPANPVTVTATCLSIP